MSSPPLLEAIITLEKIILLVGDLSVLVMMIAILTRVLLEIDSIPSIKFDTMVDWSLSVDHAVLVR